MDATRTPHTPQGAAKAPQGHALTPITYAAAMALYIATARRPFSFMAAPYGVLKTLLEEPRGELLAVSPEAARFHYEWVALRRRRPVAARATRRRTPTTRRAGQ